MLIRSLSRDIFLTIVSIALATSALAHDDASPPPPPPALHRPVPIPDPPSALYGGEVNETGVTVADMASLIPSLAESEATTPMSISEVDEPTLECRFGSSIYQVGDTFYDGCAYKCVCREGGIRACSDRCPIYVDMSGYEHCDWIPSDEDTCCMVPKCPPPSSSPPTPPLVEDTDQEESANRNETENSSSETVGHPSDSDPVPSASRDGNSDSADEEEPQDAHMAPPAEVPIRPFCVHGERVLDVGEFSAEENCVNRMCLCDLLANGTTWLNCTSQCPSLPAESLRATRDCPSPSLVTPSPDQCLCPYVVCNNNMNPLDLPGDLKAKMSCDLKGRLIEVGEEVYDECRAICHCTTSLKLECIPVDCPSRYPPTDRRAANDSLVCDEWEMDSHFVAHPPRCCPPPARCKFYSLVSSSTPPSSSSYQPASLLPLPLPPRGGNPRRLDSQPHLKAQAADKRGDPQQCTYSSGCDAALRPYYLALLVLSAFATMTTLAFLCLLYSVVRRGSTAIAPISEPAIFKIRV